MLEKDEIKFENCLFRFRDVSEKNISALKKERLYFSTSNNFNDPYDNLLFADINKIWGHVFANLEYGMDSYLEGLKDYNPQAAFVGHHFWNGTRKDEMLEEQFKLIHGAVYALKRSIRTNVIIICFSEVFNSMLMWSHYADNHKGFVLVYDKEELKNACRYDKNDEITEKKMRLEKVEYVNEQIDLSDDIEDYVRYNMLPNMEDIEVSEYHITQPKLRKIVTQKSEEWSYEKEWRLIPRTIDIEEESPLHYLECKPKGIILGARCTKENSEEIYNIATEKGIPVYRQYLNEHSAAFKLDIGREEDIIIV